MKLFFFCLMLSLFLQDMFFFTFGGEDHLSQTISDTSVIAAVGPLNISVKEFKDSYEFGPSFVKKSSNPKMTHLQFMINEKLIALDGFANGVNSDSSFNKILKEVEDDIVVTEWYKQNILPLAVVDTSQIKKGIEQASVD